MKAQITNLENGEVQITSFAVMECRAEYSSKIDEYGNMDNTHFTEDVVESFDNEMQARECFDKLSLNEEKQTIEEAILDEDGSQTFKKLVKYSYIVDEDEFNKDGVVEQYLFDNPESL